MVGACLVIFSFLIWGVLVGLWFVYAFVVVLSRVGLRVCLWTDGGEGVPGLEGEYGVRYSFIQVC